ncbi:MAG: hypothetical protein VYA80_00905 [Pseudomonadota bacterium]|nr:hypothetical protein [Pseudomonadota bacterium]
MLIWVEIMMLFQNIAKRIASLLSVFFVLLGGNVSLYATTIDPSVSLDGIPGAGSPSFSFEASSSSSSLASWFTNYTYIEPAGPGYILASQNSGNFSYQATQGGPTYEGEGFLSVSVAILGGDVVSGSFDLGGSIPGLGLSSTLLASGEIITGEAEGSIIGLQTDDIVCNAAIETCLDSESIYLFGGSDIPDFEDIDGTNGWITQSGSITTVPIPPAILMFLSGLAALLILKRKLSASS